jgi:serine/threonine protein kinase
MNNQPVTCQADRATAYAAGAMNADERAAFESHLDACEACRQALDRTVASAEDWSELQVSLSGSHDVALQSAIEAERFAPAGSGLEFCKKLLGPTDDPRMLGRIGTYEIIGLLGHGGMGVVFKGLDPSLNRYVAVKMLAPMFSANGASKQRFLREAQSAAAVVHEHVVPIHGISQWQDTPYLVMAFIRGESLQKRLAQRGPLPIRELLRIGRQVASGLAAAHAQGLIHRDIKPANILLETDVDRARITDFGLARAVDDIRLTRTDTLIGTPQYMSPEQARDEALDFRTDLFSLGVVLYEAAAGRAPFQAATSYGILRKIVDHQPKPLRQIDADIPEWFDQIVQKLMAKNPADRYQTATEVATLLEQCLAHVEQPQLVKLPASLSSPKQRNPFFNRRSVMFGGAIAGAAVVAYLMFAGGDPDTSSSTAEEPKTEQGSGGPSTTAGGYKIAVRKVGNVGNMKMDIEFDFSKIAVEQNTKSFNAPGGGGFAGGAAGGSGGTFNKPNLGIALSIHGKDKDNSIIEISNKAEAYDDQGRKLEGIGAGPTVPRFREFESSASGEPVLYLSGRKVDAKSVKELNGQLLVTPGRVTIAKFDGPKFATGKAKQFGGKSFTLKAVEKDAKGIKISVDCPPTKAAAIGGNPADRFQTMLTDRGAYRAEMVDDEGEVYSATSSSSVGGNVSGNFGGGQGGFGGRLPPQQQQGSNADHSFQFSPLPEGREIKQIRVRMTERNGPTKAIDFTLKNIPLPE